RFKLIIKSLLLWAIRWSTQKVDSMSHCLSCPDTHPRGCDQSVGRTWRNNAPSIMLVATRLTQNLTKSCSHLVVLNSQSSQVAATKSTALMIAFSSNVNLIVAD